MKKICINYYTAADWHDWASWDEFMRKPDGSFLYSDEEVDDAVLQHIATAYPDIQGKFEDIRNTLRGNENYVIWEDKDVGEYCDIQRDEDGYCVTQHSQLSSVICYDIEDADDSVKYLPVLQFVCLPKYSPSAQRCMHEPFDTPEEAETWLKKHSDEYPAAPFHDTEHRVFPMTAIDLECDWYRINSALFSNPDAKSKWHPLIEMHKKNLETNG